MRRIIFILLVSMMSGLAFAQQTYHAGVPYLQKITVGAQDCATIGTFYDPDIFALPDYRLQLFGQGNNSSVALQDQVYGSARNASTGQWLPNPATINVQGEYRRCSYDPTTGNHGPIASPSVVKVDNRYFMAYVGGNADNITGRIYWAVSSDGVTWNHYSTNAGYELIRPILLPFYEASGDGCDRYSPGRYPSGISHVSLTYHAGYFYLHFFYYHNKNNAVPPGVSLGCAHRRC